jgi:hypothetical protein
VNPKVRSPAAVGRLDCEGLALKVYDFVPIRGTCGDLVEGVTEVDVIYGVGVNRPATGKPRNEFPVINNISGEAAIAFEDNMATLGFIGVTPFSHQTAVCDRS